MEEFVRAAGGIVWRVGAEGRKLAVIHRPKRGDWSLPKGKLEHGESFESAAIREVMEETGCEVLLGEFAGASAYTSRGRPKVVLYWHMELVRERPPPNTEEVDRVLWLTPRDALRRLDRERDRELLRRALVGQQSRPLPRRRTLGRRLASAAA